MSMKNLVLTSVPELDPEVLAIMEKQYDRFLGSRQLYELHMYLYQNNYFIFALIFLALTSIASITVFVITNTRKSEGTQRLKKITGILSVALPMLLIALILVIVEDSIGIFSFIPDYLL